jgi:hypothetical protein
MCSIDSFTTTLILLEKCNIIARLPATLLLLSVSRPSIIPYVTSIIRLEDVAQAMRSLEIPEHGKVSPYSHFWKSWIVD